ncbi:hypothetical protein [Paenibacillus naphthalenovorans]|uniref:hypothetical protein n=2 Tax=Paenibacillus naphthalenovorans TaxID=162209 RepID=UPI000AE28561|nr:hypothetical protein [Paenibacillus naphthalenovorans]
MLAGYHESKNTKSEGTMFSMILYQMAKRLEERNRLQQTINNRTEGDVADLTTLKEQVEAQLISQASVWSEEGEDEFRLTVLSPETEWMQSNSHMQ